MKDELKIKLYSFTMDCINPKELADFYAKLLNWDTISIDDDWACVCPPGSNQGSYPGIMFQKNMDYIPPVWPQQPSAQQQMAHLDFAVNDLEGAVSSAINCGATEAKQQFSDTWSVMFDPSGHPFCLCQMKEIIESSNFSLL